MPLHAKRPSHPDSEEEFYEPDDGSKPPRPPSGRRFPEPTPEHHYIGDDVGTHNPHMLWTAARLAGNGALSLGGLLANGVAMGASTAINLATKANHAVVPADDRPQAGFWGHASEDEEPETEEPLRPQAKPSRTQGGSSGSGDRPNPHPFPARPFVDAAPYNGTGAHAIDLTGPDAAALRPPSRPVAQRDLRFARETLAATGDLPRKRNGR